MTEPVTQRLTLATATGLPFFVLAFHFAVGLTAIAAGSVAMAARKGRTWHLRGLITGKPAGARLVLP